MGSQRPTSPGAWWKGASVSLAMPLLKTFQAGHASLVARFMPCPLDAESDAVALVEAMRQVRNNLFHGGKEDYEDDPYAEDDDWVHAATQVALALQRSLNAGLLDAGA